MVDIKIRVQNFKAYPRCRFGGNVPYVIWNKPKAKQERNLFNPYINTMNRSTLISLLDEKLKIGNAQLQRITEHSQNEEPITQKLYHHEYIKWELESDIKRSGEEWSFDTCSLDQEEHELLIDLALARYSKCKKEESLEKWNVVINKLSNHYL